MSTQQMRTVGFALLGVACLLSAVALLLFVQDRGPAYTIYLDGDPQLIEGEFQTVGEVVEAADLDLSSADTVYPAVLEPVDPNEPILIETARSVLVITDAGQQTFITGRSTLGGFLAEVGLEPKRTDQLIADGETLTLFQIDKASLPDRLEIISALEVTVVENGIPQIHLTNTSTVGALLSEIGMTIYAADETDPPLDAWLEPEMTIEVRRAKTAIIDVDGRLIDARTRQSVVEDVLAEVGVGLVGFDYTIPALDQPIEPGEIIQVVRVTESFEVSDSPIPYESLLQPIEALEIDNRQLIQSGVPGIERTRMRIRYENGVEVAREPDGTWIAAEPQNEIVGYGTNIVVRTVNTPEGPVEYWRKLEFRVTSYMAQTSGKPPDHPAYGITASGVIAGYGVVAVDPTVVPFRSNVYVPGYGVAFVGDTGGGVKGRWIDLGYEDDWDTFVGWSGYTDVYYLTPIPAEVNYLLPTTLP